MASMEFQGRWGIGGTYIVRTKGPWDLGPRGEMWWVWGRGEAKTWELSEEGRIGNLGAVETRKKCRDIFVRNSQKSIISRDISHDQHE